MPASGRFAGVYVQAISAYAPHPNAAKLWMEFLYSDEGQNLWLTGYCHPIRYEDLDRHERRAGRRPREAAGRCRRRLPELDQLDAAKALITTEWPNVVGAVVQ